MYSESVIDEGSHYEISLRPAQAMLAFVLFLLSLGAAFAFGVMIGRGEADQRVAGSLEAGPTPPASAQPVDPANIVEMEAGLAQPVPGAEPTLIDEGFSPVVTSETSVGPGTTAPSTPVETGQAAAIDNSPSTTPATTSAQLSAPQPSSAVLPGATAPQASSKPHFAQVLSTADAKAAEGLAARLIDSGFVTAYVERAKRGTGVVHRVRVKFPSEQQARAAAARLKSITGQDPWITP